MRIARFVVEDEVEFGVIEGDEVAPIAGHPFAPFSFTGQRRALSDVRLLSPVLPSKVIGVGRNYAEHAAEHAAPVPDRPMLFLKPSTAVIGPDQPIVLPAGAGRVDFEGELAVVIGRLCRDVPVAKALEAVLGYTCGNDVSAREQQRADGQWARAKGHDTFCPLGPWLETSLDPGDLALSTTVDGEPKQAGRTSDMVFGVAELVAYASAAMTLLPGDVILTGTPAGVGPLAGGDTVTVSIDGIGALSNPVVSRG